MRKNQRVVVMDLGPNRGKTGTVEGTRRGFLGTPRARFKFIVRLDSGEVIYTGVVQKLRHDEPMAV